MSIIYTVIIVILTILAVSGLFVGVTNDAVNFLNSALGSKVSSRKTIMIVASVGIIIGVITSSGMMEVARSGMFNPELFSFHEVIMLYLGVMFANVILLDLYNSWGLPTSTTVAMIFCLLGSAVAVSIFKISDIGASWNSMAQYINTTRALGIVSAILLSVVISFTFGVFVMYISRAIFSFRYTSIFNKIGAAWCGISLTAIIYFTLFKGLKSFLSNHPLTSFIDSNLLLSLAVCWVVCSVIFFFLQRAKVNILRIVILSGTFALALAFAGNDLVNFIGVPIASFDAFKIASHGDGASMMMGALKQDTPADMTLLLLSGIIMVVTLWTSKKARRVTETEISLASQDNEDGAQYGSSPVARSLVRMTMGISNGLDRVIPKKWSDALERRFEVADIEQTGAPFDMIRASVNLTMAALLISLATSFKLPLSTTYVSFMVAMGSSLADRAWGRETAVYRISGVITVVAGWFVTAIGGFLIALVVGLALIYGGTVVFVIVTILCGYMFVKSNFFSKSEDDQKSALASAREQSADGDVLAELVDDVHAKMKQVNRIYDSVTRAVFNEDRKELRSAVKESKKLVQASIDRKYYMLSTLRKIEKNDVDTAHHYVQVVDFFSEVSSSLLNITRAVYDHVDNNHEGLSQIQLNELLEINNDLDVIYGKIDRRLGRGDYEDIKSVADLCGDLLDKIAMSKKAELKRIGNATSDGKVRTKISVLYLTILTETKSMASSVTALLPRKQK